MSQFVADFEAYMPEEFNGESYGVKGVLATADKAGIDVCVLFQGGVPADPREGNKRLLDAVEGESRILPGCLINPTMGSDAVDDLKRCVDRGARTVKLMAATHRYRIDAPCTDPIMETARSLGIPATIHSGSPLSGCSPDFIGNLAQRHPEVPIIMDHMGYREWTGLAAAAARANANIYLGTTLIAAAEPITIKKIVREQKIGADRVVFGSNSPAGVATHGVNGIRGVGFTPEEEALILGETLKGIYGI